MVVIAMNEFDIGEIELEEKEELNIGDTIVGEEVRIGEIKTDVVILGGKAIDVEYKDNKQIGANNVQEAIDKTISAIGQLGKLQTSNKTNLVSAINEVKTSVGNSFAYNFTAVGNSFIANSKDAKALDHMVKNWQTQAMSLFVTGYPVVALDINNHHMKVLYKDRYIYTFGWEVNGQLTKCYINPIASRELVYKDEVEKYVKDAIAKIPLKQMIIDVLKEYGLIETGDLTDDDTALNVDFKTENGEL
jgi:hypothetical protein